MAYACNKQLVRGYTCCLLLVFMFDYWVTTTNNYGAVSSYILCTYDYDGMSSWLFLTQYLLTSEYRRIIY